MHIETRGFPIGTTGGGDFLTGLPARELQVTVPGGGVDRRLERVVVTDKMIQYGDPPPPPGRVAFAETTVREMARLIGMVPEEALNMLRTEAARLAAERDDLSERLASALREVEVLRDRTDPRVVFVAPDGTEHASRAAMMAHVGGPRP